MAMMKCSECNGDVSDKAAVCPHCGAPTPAAHAAGAAPGVVTTQQTSKIFKVIQLLGFIVILGSTVACVAGKDASPAASATFFLGLIIFLVGRFGAWWRNG